MFGTGILHRSPFVPTKLQVFWKIIPKSKQILKFVLFVGTFWHLCEMSEFRIAHEEPVLILLVYMQDRPRWS